MANKNLANAKKQKNDEFYTQFSDIQKEVESYLEYNPNTFRNKTIYCNCDDPFESNFFRYFVLNFNRLGLKSLITTSYKPSPVANTQLGLFGDDLTLPSVKGRPKITANKFIINEVGDIDGDGSFTLEDIAKQLKENKNNEWTPLKGDGDFQSEECVELLKQADIVVTNPPFSLFRVYVKQLFNYNKKFLIIGNMNSVTHKEIFPLVKENKMWYGQSISSGDREFQVPDNYPLSAAGFRIENGKKYIRVKGVRWFTNLDHGRRHQPLNLMTKEDNIKFNKKIQNTPAYKKYENYDAIEIPITNAIPSNYNKIMGVPITFLDKYNPGQFEIIGGTTNDSSSGPTIDCGHNGKCIPQCRNHKVPVIDGKALYKRIFIKHKK